MDPIISDSQLYTNARSTNLSSQNDKRGFLDRVEACVRESQETVYENEEGSSLRFTEPKPAHVSLTFG